MTQYTTPGMPVVEPNDELTPGLGAPAHDTKPHAGPVLALLGGVMAIGFAPIFAKFAINEGMGPSASGFWRVTFAMPLMMLFWMLADGHKGTRATSGEITIKKSPQRTKWHILWLLAPGIIFAADIAAWHTSFHYTSVAMSTLLGNCQVVLVSLFGWLVLREKMRWMFPVGAGLALAGVAMLLLVSNTPIAPGRDPMTGNILALVTAAFYAAYILSIQYLRRFHSTAIVMLVSSGVSVVGLLAISLAFGETLLVSSAAAWWSVIALAVLPHFIGQGLITYSQAKLPVGFTAVTLLLQPLCVALWGWLFLSEALTALQIVGGVIVLIGIYLARRGTVRQ